MGKLTAVIVEPMLLIAQPMPINFGYFVKIQVELSVAKDYPDRSLETTASREWTIKKLAAVPFSLLATPFPMLMAQP